MDYKWSENCSLEIHRERPAMRYLITSLGGYFPVMQKLADGSVAVVARDGDLHIGQRGRLIVVTSSDGGESWSMPSSWPARVRMIATPPLVRQLTAHWWSPS